MRSSRLWSGDHAEEFTAAACQPDPVEEFTAHERKTPGAADHIRVGDLGTNDGSRMSSPRVPSPAMLRLAGGQSRSLPGAKRSRRMDGERDARGREGK